MRILLTGASGLLGSAIVRVSEELGHNCIAFKRSSWNWQNCLIDDELLFDIDLIVHAAANTDVEECEKQPEICYRDNTLLTECLAKAAAKANLNFVFISSTGIYGSHKTSPYAEFDEVKPTTHYHRSKFLAEERILQLIPGSLIIRTGWLYGGGFGIPKNFVANRIKEARGSANGEIFSNIDQYGNPCYNIDVAERILELTERGMSGVFNCVNEGSVSRYEYVQSIMEFAGLNSVVSQASSAAFNRHAKVSNNESARNWKAELLGFEKMPCWKVSLEKYIKKDLLSLSR